MSHIDVGVDVGGTFTDFTFIDRDTGRLWIKKVSSTPGHLSAAVMTGLAGVDLTRVENFVHGTTVALNSILQETGAKTAIVTTTGFRDHIEIGDTKRYTGGVFDHHWIRSKPYPVPHERRFTVDEVTRYDGTVEREPSAAELETIAAELERTGVESIAICFINAYANPANEIAVENYLNKRLPWVKTSISSLNPEFREYPRFITAVFNAFLKPVVADYIADLRQSLAAAGYTREVLYMTSAGGIASEEAMRREPMRLLFGAPAGGVAAGHYLGQLAGEPNIVTFDMGGTSTDVGFVEDGRTQVTPTTQVTAFPIAIPSLDIRSIGAGGGSIASYRDGVITVGPESAGADPGPACYGHGGENLTVTDANLLLGRLGSDAVLAGGLSLDIDAARRVAERLAAAAGIEDIYELAAGVLEICNIHMYGTMREVSIDRGRDPEQLTLVGFGGAGGLHAIPIAERLGVRRVLIPIHAGIFSALGLLVSDRRLDLVHNYTVPMSIVDVHEVHRIFGELAEAGRGTLLDEGVAGDSVEITYIAGLRYQGQVFEEELILHDTDFTLDELGEQFCDAYEAKFGIRRDPSSAEIVNLRVVAFGKTDKADLRMSWDTPSGAASLTPEPAKVRKVYFGGSFEDCPVYNRADLAEGARLTGPAIVEEYDSTIAVFPAWRARVDAFGNLIMEAQTGVPSTEGAS